MPGFLAQMDAPSIAQLPPGWPDNIPIDPELVARFIATLWFTIPISFLLQCLGLYLFYTSRVKPTEHLEMTKDSYVPPEMKGTWRVGLFDCFDDMPTCLWGCCCSAAMMSETWFRAGHANAIFKTTGPRGFVFSCLFNVGMTSCLSALSNFIECPLTVLMGVLWASMRGGIPSVPGVLGVTPLAERIGHQESPLSSLASWCCCPFCANCQENRVARMIVHHPQFAQDGAGMQPPMPGMQPMGQQPPMMQQPMGMPPMQQQPMGMQPMGAPPMDVGMMSGQPPMQPGGFEMQQQAMQQQAMMQQPMMQPGVPR